MKEEKCPICGSANVWQQFNASYYPAITRICMDCRAEWRHETPSSPIDAGRGEVWRKALEKIATQFDLDSLQAHELESIGYDLVLIAKEALQSIPALAASPAEKETEGWGDEDMKECFEAGLNRGLTEHQPGFSEWLNSYRAKTNKA